jgi:hypothetical protein
VDSGADGRAAGSAGLPCPATGPGCASRGLRVQLGTAWAKPGRRSRPASDLLAGAHKRSFLVTPTRRRPDGRRNAEADSPKLITETDRHREPALYLLGECRDPVNEMDSLMTEIATPMLAGGRYTGPGGGCAPGFPSFGRLRSPRRNRMRQDGPEQDRLEQARGRGAA